jgi:hypothetical protein
MRIAVLLLLVSGCASQSELRQRAIADAVDRGVAYIVRSQNADGSWGTGLETRGLEIYSMVPGSHDAYRVATTALCVMALREAGETAAHDRGVEYLVNHGEARRDQGDMLYNIWAHVYVLQAMAEEMRTNHDERLATAARWHLERLSRYEAYAGGWNYYDFSFHTQLPSGGATSFGTAAALIALWEARQAGIDVPQKLIDRAVRRLGEMRMANGAYLYDDERKYRPLLPANYPRGSVGRTQPCNYALLLWNDRHLGSKEVQQGLDLFRNEHQYLEMGRKRPYPHDSWYQTAPYYYYFDHYYAARLLEKLGESKKREFADVIVDGVLPHQEEDGSWWDYAMWDYHKPYGTAFAVMTLMRCR